MTSDLQPDLFTPKPATPAATACWLEQLLFGAGHWMTAGDISQTTKGRALDREIRAIASETSNLISGQKGYKHIAHATPEEVNHSANWLVSQGKKMIKRGIAQRRAAHKILS